MFFRKIKLFFKFNWIKLVVVIALIAVTISLVILISLGLKSWQNIDPWFREQTKAGLPMSLYLYSVGGMINGVVFVFLWYWVLFRGGGFQQFTHTKKKAIAGEDVGVKWEDIIGMEEAKQEALEVVKLLKDRAQLQRIGGKILRGILLLGPPGCGKTYLAKGIATEAGLPFISMSGSEFVEMFVGVGASRIRSLFKNARQLAYTEGGCIIFIDEIDAVGAQRAMDQGFGGTTEHNTTLNQLLVEMDGLKEKDYNVVLIGATNVKEDSLDQALLRPGRFDRKIYVYEPNLSDRQKIYEYYLSKINYDKSMDLGHLARRSVGKTPADIANIVRESTLIAIRNKKETVGLKEISEAMERIEMGITRKITLTSREKEMTAYHEAGHLIVTYFYHPTDDVFKATIIPHGPSLGAVYTPPREELHNYTRDMILGSIKSAVAGYAAEKVVFGTTSSGAGNDFSKATSLAHNMVWRWGMSDANIIGDYMSIPTEQLSEDLKNKLNHETQKIIHDCLKDVNELLSKEKNLLDRFAKELLEKEELDYDQIQAIFNEYGHKRRT
ncbi:MAG TPA: AAA family ATPase [Candidatus Omnitrophota bacterium]|nr:AAA family ATPase [Candidatus Omnitrophota bacterium]